jgi:hypothetical protein
MTPTITARDADRKKIESDVAAYLKAGGRIQQLPYGPDEFMADDYLTTSAEKAHREKARAKGSKASGWKKSNNTCFGKDISSEEQRRRSNAKKNKFKTQKVAA